MAKTRLQHSTALPYSQPAWPSISPESERAVLALLLPLLRPIGDHRRHVARQSKGRNRATKNLGHTRAELTQADQPEERALRDNLTIGLTSTYRSLEAQAQERRNPSSAGPGSTLAIVFVCREALPDPACNSLPLLLASASLPTSESSEAVRLVPVTEQAATTVASVLELPRVSMLGIKELVPGSKPLMQYVRETFAPVDVPWLRNGPLPAQYLPLNIEAVRIPVVQKDKSEKPQAKPVQ